MSRSCLRFRISRRCCRSLTARDALTPEERQKKTDEYYRLHAERSEKVHAINQFLRAYSLYEKDVEYVIQDEKVMIVDEFTGRILPGRRYSDGLHQAIEAKEGVRDRSGDADARHHHAAELLPHVREAGRHDRYRRNRSGRILGDLQARCRRSSRPTRSASATIRTTRSSAPAAKNTTRSSKRSREKHKAGQPVLVGTVSVEVSETLSRMLKRPGDPAQCAERQTAPARSGDRGRRRSCAAR